MQDISQCTSKNKTTVKYYVPGCVERLQKNVLFTFGLGIKSNTLWCDWRVIIWFGLAYLWKWSGQVYHRGRMVYCGIGNGYSGGLVRVVIYSNAPRWCEAHVCNQSRITLARQMLAWGTIKRRDTGWGPLGGLNIARQLCEVQMFLAPLWWLGSQPEPNNQ